MATRLRPRDRVICGLPTSATEPLVQMDFDSGTICRQTSDSRTCHAAFSDSRYSGFIYSVKPKLSVNPYLHCALEILLLTYLLYLAQVVGSYSKHRTSDLELTATCRIKLRLSLSPSLSLSLSTFKSRLKTHLFSTAFC